jgi:hypothetical protein
VVPQLHRRAGAAKKAASASRGGGEPQAKPAGAQGKGELGDHRVRLHVSGRRVLHQVEGGEKYLPCRYSDVGGRAATTN